MIMAKFEDMGAGTQTSINESHETQRSFIVFPNPASDQLFIKFNSQTIPFCRIYIYDNSGRLIFQPDCISDQGIPLTHLQAGLYFIRIESKENTQVQKLIIQ